jgi:hypothetical protein
MGMFDSLPKPWSDHFREGQVFTLLAAKVVTIPTEAFGEREAVELKIRTPEGDALFSTFGAGLVAQVKRMDAGDLPTNVRIERVASTKPGRSPLKLFVPEGQDAPDDIPF